MFRICSIMFALHVIFLIAPTTSWADKSTFIGVWAGEAIVPSGNTRIEFIFKFIEEDGDIKAEVSIPSHGLSSLKIQESLFADKKIKLKSSDLGIHYEGTLNTDSHLIEGTLYENNAWITLNLSPMNESSRVKNRPQEPSLPVEYEEEHVSFVNEQDHITLAGTLTRPTHKKAITAVVLISGNGPQDRNQNFMEHKTFLVLAHLLTNRGIAVLRYDDRGVAESEGDFSAATSFDFARDAIAGVRLLRENYKYSKVGVIGHSEGAIIAPLAANQPHSGIDFIVMLAGTGMKGDEFSIWQTMSQKGFTSSDEIAFERAIREGVKIAASDLDTATAKLKLEQHYER